MKRRCILCVLWLPLVAACGVEIGNPKNPTTGSGPSPQSIIASDENAAEILASAVETALAAVTERFSEDESTLHMSFAAPTATEDCAEENAGTLVYSRALAGTVEREVGRPLFARLYTTTLDDTFTATWKRENGGLSCTPGHHPRVPLDTSDAVTLDLVYAKKRESTVTVKRTGAVKRQSVINLSGARTTLFTPVLENGAFVGLDEEITEQHHRSLTFTSATNGSSSFDVNLATKEGSPLLVSLVGRPKDWTEKTVRSGVMTLKTAEGLYGELTWKDVTVSRADGCLPIKGTLTGAFYASDAGGEPLRAFTIDYAEATGLSATFEDGALVTLYPEACETE